MLENANLRTTAMGIMPHRDSQKALELSLSLDIPFWPQLPNFSFFEDMYVQTSENFPGIEIDEEKGRISFNKVLDEELKPIIYNEEVRPVLFDFIQRKVNRQFQILREKTEMLLFGSTNLVLRTFLAGLQAITISMRKKTIGSL